MNVEFEDTLEPLGISVGAFVIITGLGSLAGASLTTTLNNATAAIQVVGILTTVAVGAALILLSYTGDVRDLLPGGDGTADGGTSNESNVGTATDSTGGDEAPDFGMTADEESDDETDEFGVTLSPDSEDTADE